MGGRGSKYSASAQSPQPATATQAAPQSAAGGGVGMGNGQLIQNQVPDANNTPAIPDVTGTLANMTDDQLAALMNQSKTIDMPNHLNDAVDATQKFVYASGANGMPTVLDDTQFSQFMKANNISQSDVMARSVGGADYTINNVHVHLSPDQITQMMKYSQLNYVGGKHGGNVYGSGTYFDKNGGRNTGYANGATAIAVLNPKTAHVISKNTLQNQIPAWATKHPKFVAAVGRKVTSDNISIYALAMGYNVIRSDYNDYHNVIDRSALVYRQSNA